jgi:hypothetical protein
MEWSPLWVELGRSKPFGERQLPDMLRKQLR